jgi:hypothetical protein
LHLVSKSANTPEAEVRQCLLLFDPTVFPQLAKGFLMLSKKFSLVSLSRAESRDE